MMDIIYGEIEVTADMAMSWVEEWKFYRLGEMVKWNRINEEIFTSLC